MNVSLEQIEFASIAFPKDRKMLRVAEVAERLGVTEQHVTDLIEEGLLVGIDVAGYNTVRIPGPAFDDIARRLGITTAQLRSEIAAAHPQRISRASHRIAREAYEAFIRARRTDKQ